MPTRSLLLLALMSITTVMLAADNAVGMRPTVTATSSDTAQVGIAGDRQTVRVVVKNTCEQTWCPDVGERLSVRIYNHEKTDPRPGGFLARFSIDRLLQDDTPSIDETAEDVDAGNEIAGHRYRYELKDRQLKPLTQSVAYRRSAPPQGWVNSDLLLDRMRTATAQGRSSEGLDRLWDSAARKAQFNQWQGVSADEAIRRADEKAQTILPRLNRAVSNVVSPIVQKVQALLED